MAKWMEAVKAWNAKQKMVNAKHVFCMPRKGTPEHAAVMAHMKGESSKPSHPEPAAKKKGAAAAPAAKDEVADLLNEIDTFLHSAPAKKVGEKPPTKIGEIVDLTKKPRGSKAKSKLAAKHTKMMAKEEAAGRSTQRDRILAILEEELGRRR